ncbi:MAG: HU family DNA-binding protein [Candidatus Krumholzibacteriia bacterium]|nr:HU family DNA-binding protein [bacterium]
MTKAELIDAVWNSKGVNGEITKKACGEVIDNCFDIMSKTIRKEKRFSYPGFGTWTVRKRKARTGRNPQTGEKITIKASKTVGFKPSTTLKETL